MRHEIPALLAAGGGSIVNLRSSYGMAGKAAHHASPPADRDQALARVVREWVVHPPARSCANW